MESRLTEQQVELIRALYGFGPRELTVEEYLSLHPGMGEEEVRKLEVQALRRLRHLDCSFLKQQRKTG